MKEEFSKCDMCEHLELCKVRGHVLFANIGYEQYEHYIKGIGVLCERDYEQIKKSTIEIPQEIKQMFKEYGFDV